MNMKEINLNTWPRKEHFMLYHGMDCPQFNVSFPIDVTHFLAFVREQKLSFYYAMCFASVSVANRMEAFRLRIQGDKVVLYDRVHPSFTDLKKGDELFRIITMDIGGDLKEFVQDAAKRSAAQTCFLDRTEKQRDDLIYITCVPWISFTQIMHPVSINRDDSIPRISWGKYYTQDDKVLLPFSIQANHALMDGYHVGRYVELLQKYLDEV